MIEKFSHLLETYGLHLLTVLFIDLSPDLIMKVTSFIVFTGMGIWDWKNKYTDRKKLEEEKENEKE